ncbi:hypothetical protein, partial [Klebsiella pneumoniae]|uniref:hypothetical protein n=2 Tax=Klebsiella pneumoniae TaxID=573 RepID=UPI0035BBAD0B
MRRRRGFVILRLKLKRFWRRPQAGDDWQIFSANYMLWSSFFGHADQMVGLCTG